VITSYGAAIASFVSNNRNGWASLPFFQDGAARDLAAKLDALAQSGRHILPSPPDVLNALSWTSLDNSRVIILGQDPYPTPGDAHGLAFSVNYGVAIPRSLRNIFKELQSDLGIVMPSHGHLKGWADQGVLMLNTCLSVEAGVAGSHRRMGWEALTDQMISALSNKPGSSVFLLWGADAHRKSELINEKRHLVLKTPHPSPLSARRGFFNSKPFSASNAWLKAQGETEIDWRS
jgi:uracil-DNA glycosylase